MHTMADGEEEMDLVSGMTKIPFSRQTFPKKLDIVKRGWILYRSFSIDK